MKKRITMMMLLAAVASLALLSQSTVSVKGKASFYHDKFHGRRTASGTPYHKDSLTCAHLKYPFGTLLRVRNVHNGKDVVVKVTDRGPYSSRYIIDLSRAAARHLDILNHGHGDVEISVCLDGRVPFKPMPDTLRLLPITLPDTIPPFVPPPLGVLQ
jgi:rare lipoprotein A